MKNGTIERVGPIEYEPRAVHESGLPSGVYTFMLPLVFYLQM